MAYINHSFKKKKKKFIGNRKIYQEKLVTFLLFHKKFILIKLIYVKTKSM